MWITDLLQGNLQLESNRSAQNVQSTGKEQLPAALQQEIRALAPGQVLSGKIMERSGDVLKLLVNFGGSELELSARLEQSIALTMGKNILFQVKNNGSSLSLSPLFENMGMEANARKAIDMASLPVNDTTMELTGQLMKEGMSIDRDTLQVFYKEITTYADAEVMDIIDLHKLGLAVNEENLSQMNSYKNMTHQLMTGIREISQQLPGLLEEMADRGAEDDISKLLKTLLLQEDGSPAAGISRMDLQADVQEGMQTGIKDDMQTGIQESMQAGIEEGMQENIREGEPPVARESALPGGTNGMLQSVQTSVTNGIQADPGQENDAAANLVGKAAEEAATLKKSAEQYMDSSTEQGHVIKNVVADQNQSISRNLLQEVAQALSEGREMTFKELVKSPDFRKQLQQYVKQELTMRPEDTDKGKLDEVYNRLSRQLNALSQAIGNAGQENNVLGKTVQNLQQNLDFLNQLNDLYAYVQLPLKMMDNDAHGELYVYRNTKKPMGENGEVSALLHLDMANLGPMDVYVQLREDKVSTRFYLPDEEMLDFIEEHIDLLNERLEKRGYHSSCSFQMREAAKENPVMQELIEEQSNRPVPSDYSFDAFA